MSTSNDSKTPLTTATQETLLAQAIIFAIQKHEGQTDRVGQPYILHPLRMMGRAETTQEKMVAVLHDVIEDTSATIADLAPFGPDVVNAVRSLTRKGKGVEANPADTETYDDFIKRAAQNPLAARVKMLDLRDNLDVTRLGTITGDDLDRLEKYLRAYRQLLKVTQKH